MVDAVGSRDNDVLKVVGGQLRHLDVRGADKQDFICSINWDGPSAFNITAVSNLTFDALRTTLRFLQ